LNVGIQIALEKGVDYIARMDSDDLSVPERIET
jgi:glycosyltransferase involved in cell wall biosynthesis